MSYLTVNDLKNAWVFKHKSLPISESDLLKIKPMDTARSAVLWDTFISKQVDHPDFFKKGDWPFDANSWQATENWEKQWDKDESGLPQEILEHITWDNNTVVYYCVNRTLVLETTWQIFKRCWKNFLFMDDGTLLIGKKRNEALQFMTNGNVKIGKKAS